MAQPFEDGLRATILHILIPQVMVKTVMSDFRYTGESRTVGLFEKIDVPFVDAVLFKNKTNSAAITESVTEAELKGESPSLKPQEVSKKMGKASHVHTTVKNSDEK